MNLFKVPLILLAWAIERWVSVIPNWVPLVAVWATLQVTSLQFPFCFRGSIIEKLLL